MLKTPSVMSSLRWERGSSPMIAARGVDVLVREDFDRRAAQPAAVDDARVVQLVGNDDVVFRQDRRDGAGVGREPALEHDDLLDLLELGEPALELHVHFHRARDRPHRSGPDTEAPDRFERALAQLGMGRQAEIVVRRQVDYRCVIERRVGLLLAIENPQVTVKILFLEAIELLAEVGQWVGAHRTSIRRLAPASGRREAIDADCPATSIWHRH